MSYDMGYFLLSILCYDSEQTNISFVCNNHKSLSHLGLNFKWTLIMVDVSFENWGISLRWYPAISLCFNWGNIWSHGMLRPNMHTCNWWIVNNMNSLFPVVWNPPIRKLITWSQIYKGEKNIHMKTIINFSWSFWKIHH